MKNVCHKNIWRTGAVIIISVLQTGLKVNICLQEAIIMQNPNPEYVPSMYQVGAGYEP